MENLKSTNKKEENENTAKMLWESWIVDSTDLEPKECCEDQENCTSCED